MNYPAAELTGYPSSVVLSVAKAESKDLEPSGMIAQDPSTTSDSAQDDRDRRSRAAGYWTRRLIKNAVRWDRNDV